MGEHSQYKIRKYKQRTVLESLYLKPWHLLIQEQFPRVDKSQINHSVGRALGRWKGFMLPECPSFRNCLDKRVGFVYWTENVAKPDGIMSQFNMKMWSGFDTVICDACNYQIQCYVAFMKDLNGSPHTKQPCRKTDSIQLKTSLQHHTTKHLLHTYKNKKICSSATIKQFRVQIFFLY